MAVAQYTDIVSILQSIGLESRYELFDESSGL